MPAPSQLLRAARPAFRSQFFTAHAQASRTGFQTKFAGKRWQSTAAPAQAAQVGWFKRMWDSPIGLKTVHFWFVFALFMLSACIIPEYLSNICVTGPRL